MQKDLFAPLLIAAIVIGGGAFYGGMRYQASKNTRPNMMGQERMGRGTFGGPGGMGRGMMGSGQNGGFTGGEVINKDANTLTLKLRDGGSKIVVYSTSTRVSKMQDGNANDVTTGTEVIVTGNSNQDGSVTASTIQIRPAGQPAPFIRDGQPRN